MGRKKTERIRRVREFKRPSKEARRNYTSLRRMFFDLIVQEFEKSARAAASGLSDTLRAPQNQRAHRRGFSGEALYQRVIDRYTVTFNQVDAMALHYRLPMAAILLFSRVRSEVEHGGVFGKERARRLLRAFRESVLALEAAIEAGFPKTHRELARYDVYEHLDYEAFLEFRSTFLDRWDEADDQLGLPLAEGKPPD